VAGDPDFEVEEHFPHYLEYREAGRVLRISAEISTSPGTSILLFHDVAPPPVWQPPHRDVPIDSGTMRTILVRVTAAMLLLNIRPDWQTLPPEAERPDWPAIFAEARALLEGARDDRVASPERRALTAAQALLARTYAAFNARDVDAVLAVMHPDVDWPNGMEGGRVHGHGAVREYWTRQWGMIDPHVEPRAFATDREGRIVIDVHQIVRDLAGKVLTEQRVQHVYVVRDGLIASMEIRP